MKKPYIEPEMEFVTLCLKTDVLIHSPFENGGTNPNYDYNDNHDPTLPPGENPGDNIFF